MPSTTAAPSTASLRAVAVLLASIVILLGAASATQAQTPGATPTLKGSTEELHRLVNRARVAAGRLPLARSAELDAAAEEHSRSMVQHRFLDHVGPDGSTPQERAARHGYTVPPRSGWLVVEVISAISDEPSGPLTWWLEESPQIHGKVLLDPKWREIGLGFAAGGEYGHYWTVLVGCRPGVVPTLEFEGTRYTHAEQCDLTQPDALASPVPVAGAGPVVRAQHSEVIGGGSQRVSWSGIPRPSRTDWLGLYRPGDPDAAFLDWWYVSCAKTPLSSRPDGSCSFAIPRRLEGGAYEFRLFSDNGYAQLARTSTFAVPRAPEVAGARAASLRLAPQTVAAGQQVTVHWDDLSNPSPLDWLGLYAPAGPETAHLAWSYLSCSHSPGAAASEGSCTFAVPASVPAGQYEMRLYAENGYGRLARSEPFAVTAP